MALADYRQCDVCGNKTFYDANLHYDFQEHGPLGLYGLGDWAVICRDCAKTHECKVVPRDPSPQGCNDATK